MKRLLSNLFHFRIGQKLSRGMARTVGLKKFATLIGIIGGVHHMRKHQQQHARG